MNDAEKWAAYDLAKNRLSLVISHYSELVFNEQQKTAPDLAQIEKWEAEQIATLRQRARLSVTDQVKIQALNRDLEPVIKEILSQGKNTNGAVQPLRANSSRA